MKVKEIITENTLLVEDFTSMLNKIPILKIISLAFGSSFLYDHYSKMQDLETQYKQYQTGDKSTKLFGNSSPQDAAALATSEREKIIGETMLVVGTLTQSYSKVFNFIGMLVGKVGGGGGALAGGALGAFGGPAGMVAGATLGSKLGKGLGGAFGILGGLAKIIESGKAGALFQVFMSSKTGQEFLNNYIISAITTGQAELPVALYDKGVQLLKDLGVNVSSAETNIKKPSSDSTSATATPADKSNSAFAINYDSKNPKIMYINGVQVTDAEGYQYRGDKYLKDIKLHAQLLKVPDPTANIPKKPGKDYSY